MSDFGINAIISEVGQVSRDLVKKSRRHQHFCVTLECILQEIAGVHNCVKEKLEQSVRKQVGLEALLKKKALFSFRMNVVFARRQYEEGMRNAALYLWKVMKVELEDSDEKSQFVLNAKKKEKLNDFFVDRPFVVSALEKRVPLLRELAGKFMAAYSVGMEKLEERIVQACKGAGSSSNEHRPLSGKADAWSEFCHLKGNMGAREGGEEDGKGVTEDEGESEGKVDSEGEVVAEMDIQKAVEELWEESEDMEETARWKAEIEKIKG